MNLGLTETLIVSFPYISHKYRAIKYKNINIPSRFLVYTITGYSIH